MIEFQHTNLWQCDGCLRVFLGAEDGERHIIEAGDDVRAVWGDDYVDHIKCWGLMEVGGPAWEAFHGKENVHPMETVLKQVTNIMIGQMEEQFK